MQQAKLTVSKTARYFTLGALSAETKHIWVVLHGYAQLANYFLKRFEHLSGPQTCVIAPEGLHRFYQHGYDGRVVASWMTKEDRLDDINDYIRFLDQLIDEAVLPNAPGANINVIGFSQGGATASRWVSQSKHNINSLVLWASVFPPDLNFQASATRMSNMQVAVVVGDNDEFIKEEALQAHCTEMRAKGIPFKLIRYPGNHAIEPSLFPDISALAANR